LIDSQSVAPAHARILLPAGWSHCMVDSRSEIPYFNRVNEPTLTTRGAGADVQGESLKGGGTGSRELRFSTSPRRFSRCRNLSAGDAPETLWMEHNVPNMIRGKSASPPPSRHDSAPPKARAPFGNASRAPSHPIYALQN
jgi:hypothetical protein